MAKCKFCGKAVIASPVMHTACWERECQRVVENFCDHYCRFPIEAESEEELIEEHCADCALVQLLNLGV